MIQLPATTELFNLATSTRPACVRFLGESDANQAITPLAIGAFQVQAAFAGARIAEMCTVPSHTQFLKGMAADYDGAASAALNLAVRCSVTAVDLCAASMGRMTFGDHPSHPEWDANAWSQRWKSTRSADEDLNDLGDSLQRKLQTDEWIRMQGLRDQVTHRVYRRGVYATTVQIDDNLRPLAYPQHLDVEVDGVGLVPLDQLTAGFVAYAEGVWRKFCEDLAALG